jgi:3-oxoacyl-[acyl-carrier-protein] synthase II
MITEYENLRAKGPRRVSPLLIPMTMANGPAATVGPELGAQAGVHTPVSAGASGSEAVAYGLDLLHLDRADLVVVGGAEACIHPLTMSGFAQMRAMSTRNDEPRRASRPWDRGRDGFVMGEGAGVLVLERAVDAAARGRTPYAVLAGAAWAWSSVSWHALVPFTFRIQVSHRTQQTSLRVCPTCGGNVTERLVAHWFALTVIR